MTFTWNIQKIDFFTDQVEEKGLITLESAIKEFQKFPWKEQLKKAEEREMTSTFPTITFVNDKKQSLGIWTTNLDYFEIFYINGTKSANITISHDLTLNPTGVSVEDFIELFFNGEIEDNIKLDKNENTKSSQKKISDKTQFEYDINNNKNIKHLTWSFVSLLLNIFCLIIFYNKGLIKEERTLTIFMQIVLFLSWAPGIYLYITYKRKNANAKLKINNKDKSIFYSDLNQNIIFSRDEIKLCLLNVTKSSRSSWQEFQYLRIDLKNGESIYITFLLADIEQVIKHLNLHYKEEKCFMPTL